jgi:hypothetical protein
MKHYKSHCNSTKYSISVSRILICWGLHLEVVMNTDTAWSQMQCETSETGTAPMTLIRTNAPSSCTAHADGTTKDCAPSPDWTNSQQIPRQPTPHDRWLPDEDVGR